MGASLGIYWVGITDDERESGPGFWNDCRAWANFLANVHDAGSRATEARAALTKLGLGALLSHTTDGMTHDDVDWTTPDTLEAATVRLTRLIDDADSAIAPILAVYDLEANHSGPLAVEIKQDLADLANLAKFAREQGAARIAVEVNF